MVKNNYKIKGRFNFVKTSLIQCVENKLFKKVF